MKNCILVFTLASLLSSTLFAQQDLPDLSDDVKNALAEITIQDVTATVSFLASDELAGRQTPSPELDIAGAYIASRFRGAGLEGGATRDGEKSFFQVHTVPTTHYNAQEIVLSKDGKAIEHFGMLAAGEAFEFSGEIKFVGAEDDWKSMNFEGPVCFTPPAIKRSRDMLNVMLTAIGLRQRGATAVLLQAAPDSPYVEQAKRAQQPSLTDQRLSWPPRTLVVPPMEAGGNFEIALPAKITGNTEVKNVIGVLPGSDAELSQQAIIITAHLDHIGTNPGTGDTINNGADDNATGCTAVCELADAFGALENRPKRTIIFMTFWGEEKGLLGSRQYCKAPAWPLEKTIANINIEMVGRPEPGAHEKAWMTGWHESDLGELMGAGSAKAGVMIFEHPKFSEMLYKASDNAPFVEKGVIGHSFSAGSLHSDYHQPSDQWERLELRHMTKVIQGLFVGTLPIANGEVTPKKK